MRTYCDVGVKHSRRVSLSSLLPSHCYSSCLIRLACSELHPRLPLRSLATASQNVPHSIQISTRIPPVCPTILCRYPERCAPDPPIAARSSEEAETVRDTEGAQANEFLAARQATKEHAGGSADLWKKVRCLCQLRGIPRQLSDDGELPHETNRSPSTSPSPLSS